MHLADGGDLLRLIKKNSTKDMYLHNYLGGCQKKKFGGL